MHCFILSSTMYWSLGTEWVRNILTWREMHIKQIFVFKEPEYHSGSLLGRWNSLPLKSLLTCRSSNFGPIQRRSKANRCPEWFFYNPRSQRVQHHIFIPVNRLILQHTLRSLLPLLIRISLPTIEALLRLRRCLYPATDPCLELHLCRPPSQHSRYPITRRWRPLPSLLHQNSTTAPCGCPPWRQGHLRRRRRENEQWQ